MKFYPISQRLYALFFLIGVFGLSVSPGCQSDKTPSDVAQNTEYAVPRSIQEGVEPQESSKSVLLAAKEDLFQQLSGRLMTAMNTGGPVEAVEVCQKQAPSIAKEVGEKHNVRIGRSGVRLRNPSNAPPDWAKLLVEAKSESPTFVTLTNDKAAALLPIKLQPQCLMCHGPSEQIAEDVQIVLKKHYPRDEATGFQAGELRGWFWVEEL